MVLSNRRNRFRLVANAFGFSTTVPYEHVSMMPKPTSTPTVVPSLTGYGSWPSSTKKRANRVPAVRLMHTSRMEPWNRSCSVIATRPIFGRMTALPFTFTVSGPLSARKPCSCLLRLNLRKPTRLPECWPVSSPCGGTRPQPWAAARKDPAAARRFLWNLGGPVSCWGLRQLAMCLIPRPRMSGDAEVVDEARDADGAAAVAFLLAGLWRVPIPTTE